MKKKVHIYFNRWFSVAYHYMNLIRNNADGLEVKLFGTHPDPRHMSLQACDHAETEPALKGMEYVEFCVEFCRKHEIDVFIPRLHMLDIARHLDLFEEIGTRVVVCRDTGLLEMLMEKDHFYKSVEKTGVMVIPDYEVVNDAEGFKRAYDRLTALGHRVCFKPTNSEGGVGFRIIDDTRDPLEELFGVSTRLVSFRDAYQALGTVHEFPNLMVMEHLPGLEYSIDCFASKEGELLAA
ncbi:ATP-grasp domain-containing protein, partial [Paenibacillus sepulcri]|nr:ATP-grasp domain-containing protein [Paenibacillus sepulcri]